MKRITVFLFTSVLTISCLTTSVYADTLVEDSMVAGVDTATAQSHGSGEVDTVGSTDNDTKSSKNSSGAGYTSAQLNAQSAKSDIQSTLKNYISKIKGSDMFKIARAPGADGAWSNNDALIQFGLMAVPRSEIQSLSDKLQNFVSASAAVGSGDYNFNTLSASSVPSVSLPSGDSIWENYGNIDRLLAEAIAANEGIDMDFYTSNAGPIVMESGKDTSGSYASGSSSNSSNNGSGGSSTSESSFQTDDDSGGSSGGGRRVQGNDGNYGTLFEDIPGFNGDLFDLSFNPYGDSLLAFNPKLPEYSLDGYTGLRMDLFSGGMNDGTLYSQRINSLSRYFDNTALGSSSNSTDSGTGGGVSNQMEDYCDLLYIDEYHVYSVSDSEIHIIDYTSDLRKWVVYAEGHMDTPLKEAYTDNPMHEFTFGTDESGTYIIKAYQEARYTERQYAYYDICSYLLDAETGNVLYFTESLVSNGAGGAVMLDSEEYTGMVPTGDEFVIHVNDLGEISKEGSATQRVK